MSVAAFLGGSASNDYTNENKFGLRCPRPFSSYLVLAEEIEKVHTSLVTVNAVSASNYLEVLALAFKVFGPRMCWLLDHEPKRIGHMTGRFINETKELVYGNVPREIDVRSWDILLDGPNIAISLVNVVQRDELNSSRTVNLGNSVTPTPAKNYSRSMKEGSEHEYLSKWLNQPAGISDMMFTLQHCYGKQSLARQLDVSS